MTATGLDRFQLYLDHVQDCIILTDDAGTVVTASRSTSRLFQANFVGLSLLDRVAEGVSKAAFSAWLAEYESRTSASPATAASQLTDLRLEIQGVQHWRPMQGSAFRCMMDDQIHYVVTLRDIKSQLERESSLIREATTDPLTGLLNRRGFQAELERCLGRPLAVAFLDVDDFKQVNDRQGHAGGDQTLREVAAMLNRALPTSTVARLGGDEFGVVLSLDGRLAGDADAIEQQFVHAVKGIGKADSAGLKNSTVSCGVAFDFAGRCSARELLAAADQMLYRSKSAGKNQVTRSDLSSLDAT